MALELGPAAIAFRLPLKVSAAAGCMAALRVQAPQKAIKTHESMACILLMQLKNAKLCAAWLRLAQKLLWRFLICSEASTALGSKKKVTIGDAGHRQSGFTTNAENLLTGQDAAKRFYAVAILW